MLTHYTQRAVTPALLIAAVGMINVVVVSEAKAFNYRSAWMESWSGCECGGTPLSYTSDQIDGFNSELDSLGNSRVNTYANQDVWSSDYTEDSITANGNDRTFSDDVSVYAYSGHGDAFRDSAGKQHYTFPTCKGGGVSATAPSGNACNLDMTDRARMGELSGAPYSSPYAGNIRWMIMATCFSVDASPGEQWWWNMRYGTEYVMGYKGLSADSYTTDEVLGDFISEAFDPNRVFKGSWFWAVDDWWVNDTGGVVTVGTSTSNAETRRDLYHHSLPRRTSTSSYNYSAWSFHEG